MALESSLSDSHTVPKKYWPESQVKKVLNFTAKGLSCSTLVFFFFRHPSTSASLSESYGPISILNLWSVCLLLETQLVISSYQSSTGH